jgi:hypothetical protein
MTADEKTMFRCALIQIWETLYDHNVVTSSCVESRMQHQAALNNIKVLDNLVNKENSFNLLSTP